MIKETPKQKRERLGQHICLKCGGLASPWWLLHSERYIYICRKCNHSWNKVSPKRKNRIKELTILMNAIANRIEDNQSRRVCICKWVLAAIREVVPKNE